MPERIVRDPFIFKDVAEKMTSKLTKTNYENLEDLYSFKQLQEQRRGMSLVEFQMSLISD